MADNIYNPMADQIEHRSDPRKMKRRDFISNMSMAVGAAGLTGLGIGGVITDIAKAGASFNLEKEVATGKLRLTSSESYGDEQEMAYGLIRDAINVQDTRQLGKLLKDEWAQNPDDPGKAVIAKAIAYTLASDLPNKEAIVQTFLQSTPAARNVRYLTRDAVSDKNPAVIKPLTELVKDGYMRDFPEDKRGIVIQPDEKMARRLELYIISLSNASQDKGR